MPPHAPPAWARTEAVPAASAYWPTVGEAARRGARAAKAAKAPELTGRAECPSSSSGASAWRQASQQRCPGSGESTPSWSIDTEALPQDSLHEDRLERRRSESSSLDAHREAEDSQLDEMESMAEDRVGSNAGQSSWDVLSQRSTVTSMAASTCCSTAFGFGAGHRESKGLREERPLLSEECARTAELEKSLQFYASQISLKVAQIQAQRERQLEVQVAFKIDEGLECQRGRFEDFQSLIEELGAMEASLTRTLSAEKQRSVAMELRANAHREQLSIEALLGSCADADPSDHQPVEAEASRDTSGQSCTAKPPGIFSEDKDAEGQPEERGPRGKRADQSEVFLTLRHLGTSRREVQAQDVTNLADTAYSRQRWSDQLEEVKDGIPDLHESRRRRCDQMEEIEETASVQTAVPKSIDFVSHAQGKCKPCAYFHRSRCSRGLQCQFCHVCGPTSKDQRRRARQGNLKTADLQSRCSNQEAGTSTTASSHPPMELIPHSPRALSP